MIKIHKSYVRSPLRFAFPIETPELAGKVIDQFKAEGDFLIGDLEGHDDKSLAASLATAWANQIAKGKEAHLEKLTRQAQDVSSRTQSPPPAKIPLRPADETTASAPPSEPTLFDSRIAVCRTCDQFAADACKLIRDGHCSPCYFRGYLSRPAAVCPKQATSQWGR